MAAAAATATASLFFVLVLLSLKLQPILCETDVQDMAVLRALKVQWTNTPSSWGKSDDPCGSPWDGVTCSGANRVTAISLQSMGLKGQLPPDIFGLEDLTSLDLSFNIDLTGSLSPQIGQLIKLNTLVLRGCSFIGSIPPELGNLSELLFLSLDSNQFTGVIPASLGNLSNLQWLDLSDNQLTGPLPVSGPSSPGLDMLLEARHFHLQKNQLSGTILPQLFRPEMKLFHILLHGNKFSGPIPSTLGQIQPLAVLRLDRNNLSGEVPASSLSNLTQINELNLGYNQLSGPLPNLTGALSSLQFLDFSNNLFDKSEFPVWLLELNSLMTLVIDNGPLTGSLPEKLFSLPELQQVNLTNNSLSGKLDMGDSVGPNLRLVNLQHNKITLFTRAPSYNETVILTDNPVCSSSNELSKTSYCQLPQPKPYSTSLGSCSSTKCPQRGQKPNLQSQRCDCAYPYEGTLYFSASLSDLTNYTVFQLLEKDMCAKLMLGSVLLENLHINLFGELQMDVSLFPSKEMHFNGSDLQRISTDLTNHSYLPPPNLGFGLYSFVGDPYIVQVLEDGKPGVSKSLILGISLGSALLVLVLISVGMYAIWQKQRPGMASVTKSFASSGNGSVSSVQLKGARWFSYEELKKCTGRFSSSNVIGSGGYGMVYKGVLPDGKLVAIKRAFQGSTQGGEEFKTEIELLSRVHHKNLVGLIGFCSEQAEQILVYEFLPNGSVKDSLLGKSGIHLSWRKRLQVALGSARGLTYLHELANPPIIHRDVKSNNILLDDNLNAKVADFGVSKLVLDSAKTHVSTEIKGTMGYLDPEYYQLQQLTEKSDVYSFGVVMLELLTAKQPIEKGKNMVREVRTALDKGKRDLWGLRELLDPTISSGFTAGSPGFGMYVELALQCAEDLASNRPTMGEVVKAIEKILHTEGITSNPSVRSVSSTFTDFSSN